MSEPICGPGLPTADRVEINNGVQQGPAIIHGQDGKRLDHTDAGRMKFWVDVVDAEGGRINMSDGTSYEQAIVDAEECARDWGVAVHDRVAA